jgi:hypothetical protein
VPLQCEKIGVRCAITATRVVESIFLERLLIQNGMSVTFFFPLLRAMREKERHVYFMQDCAVAHTANYSIGVLNEMFSYRLISRRLWPPRSPYLNLCDFYLWGNRKRSVFI